MKTEGIRDTSAQDVRIEKSPRRLRWLAGGAGAIALIAAGTFFASALSTWFNAEASVSADRIRVAMVHRGDLVRDLSVQGRVVAAVSPAEGSHAGGTVVTIRGEHLGETIQVTFGGADGTDVTVEDDSTVTCTTPPREDGHGPVDVVVTTRSGSEVLAGGFTYIDPEIRLPVISSVDPAEGPATGGTLVTITGLNLASTTQVTFGGHEASGLSAEKRS